MSKQCVIIHVDGSCSGNPGPGGWAAILSCNGVSKELSGHLPSTTNNRAEMTAVEQALLALKTGCTVMVCSDSQNVIGWLCHGYKCRVPELIRLRNNIHALINEKGHQVSFTKVEGHAGDPFNERCDLLAKSRVRG